ncbi:MAG: hypothetical protein IAI50_10585 [Candidatus Eremiobacteraeota bacterium]|nr:hypothetical protein [Candidatus Eremiobacteraeota bacterium]
MSKFFIALAGWLIFGVSIGLPTSASEKPPQIAAADAGAKIGDISIEAYGVTNARIAMRYLALHKGDIVTQSAVLRDYKNLMMLAGLRTRLTIQRKADSGEVTLHWIVLGPVFAPTDHPFYGDQPLSIPIEGFGTVLTSAPLDKAGANLSAITQVALRAQLARVSFTNPLWVDAATGREGDLIISSYGGRGVFRATEPITEDIYSWVMAEEALYLVHGTSGTQYEFGIRSSRATAAHPTYITAPSLIDTYYDAVRTTALEAGLSHTCPVAPTHWYPPNCYVQYRFEGFDSIGGLGANSEYRTIFADVAQYTRVGSSTIAVHGSVSRSGGVLPTSFLLCAYTFGYAKATCGTDTNLFQTEFRLADARPGPFKFILFTETASSRIRGGTQAFAPPTFQWRADSGVGLQYRGFRFNVASGSDGGRITYEVQGQLF